MLGRFPELRGGKRDGVQRFRPLALPVGMGVWQDVRAVHALTRGDLAGAVDLNVLTVVLLPVLVLAWVAWLAFRLGRRPAPLHVPTWAGTAVAVAVPAFWVLRNLPVGSPLAP